ncbi:uncharacterized protein LOC124118196 [Haliotis rufescens]|uniref:uncharacterized protein LOC124118196 n=1 Tax=Haliotis rufescens TaxID=6454 RepID=UPI00201E9A68|nr:uncharacterized protein LOC124118196 [Haliotis rufescens]
MVKGMTNFTTGNYQHDSKMMAVYLRASDKVISLLEKRQEILMNKLKIANVNGKIRMQVTTGVYKRTKRVTDRWNSKCQDKFIEWVNKVGENPTEKDLEKAKAKIDMIAANYVDAVKKLFDHLSATLDKNDQGYYLDAVKQENGNPKKMMALMRDIKKISANLGSAIQEKKADMEPHHDKKHMPSAAEVHLMKRLGSVRVHALDAFSEFQKGILAKCSPKDRSKPVDIAILKHGLKLLEVKKDELLKKAVLEMEDIIEQDKVAPELVPLKEKLSTIAQDIFNQEKTSRMPELTAIMVDLTHRVGKKPGAKIIERMLRKESMKEMALMQIAIGDAVLKAVDRLGHSGGSLEEQVEKGSSSLKSTITEVMDKTRDSLKEFVDRNVNDLETGQGIFGHIKKLDTRTKN